MIAGCERGDHEGEEKMEHSCLILGNLQNYKSCSQCALHFPTAANYQNVRSNRAKEHSLHQSSYNQHTAKFFRKFNLPS